jgi:type IV pilus assembly protein PilY1
MKNVKVPQHAIKPVVVAVAVGLAMLARTGAATDWNLSPRPLDLGNSVPANLLFVVDDSGSMDWEIISKDATNDGRFTGPQPDGSSSAGDGGIVGRSSCGKVFSYGVQFNSNQSGSLCSVVVGNEWRFRNADFNPFYFNPRKQYVPWAGVDEKSVPFGNVSLSKAWDNVYRKDSFAAAEWIDLGTRGPEKSSTANGDNHVALSGGFRFYTWNDDGDKKFENGEETEYSIGSLSSVPSGWFGNSVEDVKTNFANWFSYYRGREQVAKAAFGRVVADVSGVNMGLMTLHDNNNVATPLALIDQTPVGESNRATLMRNIYRINSSGGTPLQQAMKDAGQYLSNQTPSTTSGLPKKSPLSAAQGGECQQNFVVAMTDGYYNGTYSDSSPTIGNADKGSGPWDGGAYADKYSKTLGDIAMHYYENDIDLTNANKVPKIKGVDENSAQHVVTFTIAFGVNGTLSADPTDPTAEFTWPDPTSSDAARVDDLRHAAYNGRGEFLTAQNPDELVSSLNYMLSSIQARWGSSGGVAFNSGTLRANSLVFEGRYHSSDWHGEFLFLPIDSTGAVGAPIADAGAILADATKTDFKKRTIISLDPDTKKAIPFQWSDLSKSPTWSAALGSAAVADWLRGNHECEVSSTLTTCATTKSLRNRLGGTNGFRLGDVVSSGPAYVAAPHALYEFDDYASFVAARKDRKPVVYVGANDGMLHGFDASVGNDGKPTATTATEVFAYVPSALALKLKKLSEPGYVHDFFVDGTPTVGDAYFGGAWHSVLTSGLRGGGQAVFALDVTDPAQFSDANAGKLLLWEFSDKDDADLGYTYSQPNIAKLGNGKFAAVFGNGYNSTVADGKVGSGNAVLFVVDLETKSVVKLDTGVGPAQDPEGKSRPNGLSDVALVDVDADRIADFAYAGDLFGNLWRFDLTAADSASWSVSFGGKPLFTARSPDNKMQSITARPAVGPHPAQAGYLVYFGTGKFLEPSDNSVTGQTTQSFYAIWDKGTKVDPPAFVSFARANLLAQQILEQGATRVTSDKSVDWAAQQGWYIDLVYKGSNNGERIVTEPLIRNGLVLFTTMSPETVVCGSDGSGYIMALDVASGSRLATSPFDVTGDGQFTSSDLGSLSTPPGTTVAISGVKVTGGIPSAPAVIEGAGGMIDLIAVNVSGGYVGGSGLGSAPNVLDKLAKFGIQGRLSWERLK